MDIIDESAVLVPRVLAGRREWAELVVSGGSLSKEDLWIGHFKGSEKEEFI